MVWYWILNPEIASSILVSPIFTFGGSLEKLCRNCGVSISHKSDKKAVFCSRSCSAKFNNKKYPKRQKTKECRECKSLIASGRIYCSTDCYLKERNGQTGWNKR